MDNDEGLLTGCVQLFRARQLQAVVIGIVGASVEGLPQTETEVTEWLTRAHKERRQIPVFLRSDVTPGRWGNLTPECDPTQLRAATRESLEGRLWLGYVLEEQRGRANFVQRLVRVLEKAGLRVTARDAMLSADELSLERSAQRAASSEVRISRSQDIANGVCEAAVRENVRQASGGPRARLSASQLAGDCGLKLRDQFHVSTAAVQEAGWVWYYEQHGPAYARARAFHAGRLVNSHKEGLSLSTDAQATYLAANTLTAVFRTDLRRFVSGRVVLRGKPEQKEDFKFGRRAMAFLSGHIGTSFLQAFGSCRGKFGPKALARFRKSIEAGTLARKQVVVLTSPVLAYIGLVARPVYGGGRKGPPVAYRLCYAWSLPKTLDGETVPPPHPLPQDPRAATWQPEGKAPDLVAGDADERHVSTSSLEEEDEAQEDEEEEKKNNDKAPARKKLRRCDGEPRRGQIQEVPGGAQEQHAKGPARKRARPRKCIASDSGSEIESSCLPDARGEHADRRGGQSQDAR